MTQDTIPAYLRGGSARKKPPKKGRRTWLLEVFFAAACVYFSALLYFNKIHTGPIFILVCLLALFSGAFIELKVGRRFSVFAYPAIILAFRFTFYAFFGVLFGQWWNIALSALSVIAVYLGMKWLSGSGFGATLAAFVFALALPSGVFMVQMSFDREGSCALESDDVLSMGGTLWDKPGSYALTCDMDGRSVFASFPKDKTINRIYDTENPEADMMPKIDSAYVMELEPDYHKLTILMQNSRELNFYRSQNMELLRSFSTQKHHCDLPIAIAKDQTLDNTLVLCRDKGRMIFADMSSRNNMWNVDDVASMPSGLAVSNYMERAYVTDLFGSSLRLVDLATHYPVAKIHTGFSSSGIVASSDGRSLFIGRPISGRVEIYDVDRLERKHFRYLMRGVDMLRGDDEGRYIFAASRIRGTAAVWDISAEVAYGPYKIGRPINDIEYCSVSKRLYISTPCAIRYLNVLMLK